MKSDQIAQSLAQLSAHYALYSHPRDGQPVFLFNELRFKSASLIKVPILLSWLVLEGDGQLSRLELCDLDAEIQVQGAGFARQFTARKLPYADVLLMMIATSDNLCTNLVIDRIGLERLNQVFTRKLGLKQTACQRKLMDYEARSRGLDNWVQAEEAIHFYDLIEGLEPSDCDWVESLLLANTDSALLMRDLPRDTVNFYHKTGSMEGVLHDWGYTHEHRLFLLTNEVKEEPPVFELFGELGKTLSGAAG